MEAIQWKGIVVFSNSTHISKDTAYGKSKRDCAELLSAWAKKNQSTFFDLVLPHVFGEFGKPFYNSVVSTFCYQLANTQKPVIDVDGNLELLHAGDVASLIFEKILLLRKDKNPVSQLRAQGTPLKVSKLLSLLNDMMETYESGIIPNLSSSFEVQLFNTLRNYIFEKNPKMTAKIHSDNRGYLFEAIKTKGPGQTFFSTTKPGIVRGNHFHRRKIERFCVVGGEAVIKLRALHSKEVITVKCNGAEPVYVDIPTLHTHNITNTGKSELLTMFWSNEIFDPSDSDTYPLPVENE
jgi:UDP-2-acetamido-2,6-beta-L-arabino-hexul-4-ose reductase